MQPSVPIERVENPAVETLLRDFVRPGRPVILRGVADRWPAMSRWSPEHLRSRFPDLKVPVEVAELDPTSTDPQTRLEGTTPVKMTLAEYIDTALGPTPPDKTYYLAQFPLLERAPELKGDIDSLDAYMDISSVYPERLKAKLRLPAGLWLGPAGSLSTLHFDVAQNYLVQITGRKRLVLFPPDQSNLLHYPHFGARMLHFSPVDVEKPDLQRFPRFERATPLECTLEPGEILHIPSGWWHFVRSLEPALSLNFWWIRPGVLLARRDFLLRQIGALLRKRILGGVE
jgi:lysine-specific demethylase 8